MLQKSLLLTSALGGARALTMRQNGCSFHLRTEGTVAAPVGQYPSGQTRVGQNETASSFTVTDGTFTDSQNRGCWWTPPTTVLQCDVGQIPEAGFSIACDGTVSHNGQTTFYTCNTGADGLHMIYLEPNGSQCSEITLLADGCYPSDCGGPANTTTSTSSSTGGYPSSSSSTPPSGPSQTGTPGGCPGDLSGTYEYPHLIIPVDSSAPDSAPGTSYFGEVSPTISSAFNFDIPQSASGRTCNLVFYFPTQSQLETSSFNFTGSGAVDFQRLGSPVSESTSYANLPPAAESYGTQTLAPGNGYQITSFGCPAGQAVAFEMTAANGDNSTDFRYFQDYNPCPIGLYVTVS
ncbi:ubiquitin 3 binding protein But2 C-terminal domain-containing protein [Xylaria digitata]|nr:ubiquitin 3 binding protein But2 C-terminal domain-containing protein [Xylaria digitata]